MQVDMETWTASATVAASHTKDCGGVTTGIDVGNAGTCVGTRTDGAGVAVEFGSGMDALHSPQDSLHITNM